VTSSLIKHTLLAAGVLVVLLSESPGAASTTYAIPPAALTPTGEPATRTPIPATTIIATHQPRPTLTPTNAAPAATDTPTPRPHNHNAHANPALTKSASPTEAQIGDSIDFRLTITNYGDEEADDVVLTDPLPEFLDVVDVTADKGTFTITGRTVVIVLGTLAPGETIAVHIRAQVNAQARPPGGTNTATLTTSSDSNDTRDDVAGASVAITPLNAVLAATPSATMVGEATAIPAQPTTATGRGPAHSRPVPVSGGAGGAPRPRMPRTGAIDGPAGVAWPLTLLGLVAILLSLLIRRRCAHH